MGSRRRHYGVLAAARQVRTTEFEKRWSRLCGILLLLGLLLFAGKVADGQADFERFFSGIGVPIAPALWLLALEFPPAPRLTLNGVYRKYFTKVEFDALVELGEHLAERVDAWHAVKPERIATGK